MRDHFMEENESADMVKITAYLDQLIASLGIRANIEEETLRKLHDQGKYAECIGIIKRHMRLPLTLRVAVLEYPKWVSAMASFGLPPNDQAGAAILVPGVLPLYGTPDFEALCLKMIIDRRFAQVDSGVFIQAVAHELSHVVLLAIRHPLRRSEIATDLAAMVLGFGSIMYRTQQRFGHVSRYTDGFIPQAYEHIRRAKLLAA